VYLSQAERELSDVGLQVDELSERLEEADGISSAQVAVNHLTFTFTCIAPHHLI